MLSPEKIVASSLPVTKSLHLPLLFLFPLPHSQFHFQHLPIALCPMPYAPCALRSAHLLIFQRPTIMTLRSTGHPVQLDGASQLPSFPPSLRGVGLYGPYGFRLVDRAYSSERPEATSHVCLQPYAPCPMPYALCSPSHLPIFFLSRLPQFLHLVPFNIRGRTFDLPACLDNDVRPI